MIAGISIAGIIVVAGILLVCELIYHKHQVKKELEQIDRDYQTIKETLLANEKMITKDYKEELKYFKKLNFDYLPDVYAIVNLYDKYTDKYKKSMIRANNISHTASSVVINYDMDISHHVFRGDKIQRFTFTLPASEYNITWFPTQKMAAYAYLQAIKNNERIEYKADLIY